MEASKLVEHCGSKRQAARQMGVTRQTIYNWLAKGRIPPAWAQKAVEIVNGKQAA